MSFYEKVDQILKDPKYEKEDPFLEAIYICTLEELEESFVSVDNGTDGVYQREYISQWLELCKNAESAKYLYYQIYNLCEYESSAAKEKWASYCETLDEIKEICYCKGYIIFSEILIKWSKLAEKEGELLELYKYIQLLRRLQIKDDRSAISFKLVEIDSALNKFDDDFLETCLIVENTIKQKIELSGGDWDSFQEHCWSGMDYYKTVLSMYTSFSLVDPRYI